MDNISYDDFSKLDLRVAKIISTEKIPEKSRIIKGIISLGTEERDVIIGGAQYYEPEDLIGKIVIVHSFFHFSQPGWLHEALGPFSDERSQNFASVGTPKTSVR